MLNFILYDDNISFLKELDKIITTYMMNLDIEYEIHKYNKCDQNMKKIIIDDLPNKIYFLDIETKDESGLDIFRMIRETQGDWHSLVLIVTNHNEYKYEALGNRLYLFDFINKLDAFKENVRTALDRIVKIYVTDSQCIKIKKDSNLYKISFRDIVSLNKQKGVNKLIIKTKYEDIEINSSLKNIEKLLNDDFLKVSSSNIVNKMHIYRFDKINNKIIFDDMSETVDISRRNRKRLEDL